MKCAWPTAPPLASHLTRPIRISSLSRCPATSAMHSERIQSSWLAKPVHHPVVLFNHVIEIFALTQSDAARDDAIGFQQFHRSRIGRVLVYAHHPWHRIARFPTALRRKRLAAVSRLAVSRKSIVCPVESGARYRYLSSPFAFIWVSSIR
jgi:hypothetical protein